MYIYIYTHTYIHTYIYIYICTHRTAYPQRGGKEVRTAGEVRRVRVWRQGDNNNSIINMNTCINTNNTCHSSNNN